MKKTPLRALFLPCLCATLLLAGCTVQSGRLSSANLFDLGPLPISTIAATSNAAAPAATRAIAISVAEITPAAWLDSPRMFYRLLYADAQQPRAYAEHRWIMQPTDLFGQRLKARIVQAGGIAASAVDGASNLPLLKIEADDFSHIFESPEKSYGSIVLRATLYDGRKLVAQKSFSVRQPASSNDASGAARALAVASDTTIAEIMTWLSRQPITTQMPQR